LAIYLLTIRQSHPSIFRGNLVRPALALRFASKYLEFLAHGLRESKAEACTPVIR
jgi:hypothetical protein